jgi:hypothetical protein
LAVPAEAAASDTTSVRSGGGGTGKRARPARSSSGEAKSKVPVAPLVIGLAALVAVGAAAFYLVAPRDDDTRLGRAPAAAVGTAVVAAKAAGQGPPPVGTPTPPAPAVTKPLVKKTPEKPVAKPAVKPPSTAGRKPLRVLFLGNSYTSYNRLPQVVAGLANADTTTAPMEVRGLTSNGKDLVWHSQNRRALDAIAGGKWDYVVLQDQSLTPALLPDRTRAGAGVLDAAIRKAGARTVFFMTWRRRPTPALLKKYPGMHERNAGTYVAVGRKLKALVAPVGYAWKTAYDADPKLPLYTGDGSHPAPMGTYLAACVFYATLYDKPPTGLPGKVTVSNKTLVNIPCPVAERLQRIAWEAVQQVRKELPSEAGP